MLQFKYLLINGKYYRLVSDDGEVWWLAGSKERRELNARGPRYLYDWRKKGVIKSEAEKEKEG